MNIVDAIQMAKQAYLPAALQNEGIPLVKAGKEFYHKDHDSLRFYQTNEGTWAFKWWSKGLAGDGIDYLREHCDLNFHTAIERLTGIDCRWRNEKPGLERKIESQNDEKQTSENWQSQNWQNKAKSLVKFARSNLFKSSCKEKLYYLKDERGLTDHSIKKFNLGCLQEKGNMLPKIVIPCYDCKGRLMRVRFRIDNHEKGNRFQVMKGSSNQVEAIDLRPGKPVMIVESELDSRLISQVTKGSIGVIALGSTGNSLTEKQLDYLNKHVPLTLLSLDNDEPGRKKTKDLMNQIKKNTIDYPVYKQYGKDPGEAHKRMNLEIWVKAGIEKGENLQKQKWASYHKLKNRCLEAVQ